MPRLRLSMPEELAASRRTAESETGAALTDRPPGQVGPGQRARDELAARTVRWFACWAGKS